MGVRGLTSFIARHAEEFLKPYELHDTDLVIDGDNLACNLYKDVSGCNSAFGGDYDEFYRTCVSFFHILSECNVRSYVLLDGGYEYKKMRTVEQRMRNKISVIKHLNPGQCRPMFPLMMREVFVEACTDCNVNVMRCLFEADDELAAFSRKLNCPLLSYDSDFYIHNVKYIPMITLTMRVLQKKESKFGKRDELRQCQARNLKKRKEMNRGQKIVVETVQDSIEEDCVESEAEKEEEIEAEKIAKKTKRTRKTIKYLDCCLYRIENLIQRKQLSKDKLPLFAALLGNDYIPRQVFNKFYSQVGMKGVTRRRIPQQQKRVMAILRWLSHETLQSAMEKIMSKMKKGERDMLEKQMRLATDGYLNEESEAFEFFRLSADDCVAQTSDEEEFSDEEDDESENSIEIIDSQSEKSQSEAELDEEPNESEFESVDECDEINSESNESEILDSENKADLDDTVFKSSSAKDRIPASIRKRIFAASLPRYITDLLYQNLYINQPQIENFLYPDANEIALPIVLDIFSQLIHPETTDLRYLTRVTHLTNVVYKRFSVTQPSTPLNFVSTDENLEPIKECFSKLKQIDSSELFSKLSQVPDDLQLYFLAIIYWFLNSAHSDAFHLKSLLICLTILRTCDSKIAPIRNQKQFHKKFGKQLQKEKLIRAKSTENVKKTKKMLADLRPQDKVRYVPKIELLLVQENILKYFHYQDSYRKKHTEFSSIILHGFAEFQAVCLQLYTLNALCNFPLQNFKLSQLYNGVFLYNLYSSLKQRPDIKHYIKMHLFRESEILSEFYEELENWLTSFLPILNETVVDKLTNSKKILKKRRQIEKKKQLKIGHKMEILTADMVEKNDNSFNDLNNKFCTLAIN